MGLVQNMAVLSPKELCTEAIEGSSSRLAWQQVERSDEKVVCPMPRKIATVSFMKGESVKPFWQRCGLLPSTLDGEANHEILEIFRSKTSCGNATSFGRSPPYFSGSPPSRAGNPMIRDVEFCHQRRPPLPASIMQSNPVVQDVVFSQKRLPSPLPAKSMQPKLALTTATFRSSPCVRVEGFDCPGRGFECTSRDTRRHVPALA